MADAFFLRYNGKMCSVLIVNDVRILCAKLRHICEMEGLHVAAEAKNFNQALEEFKKHKPDYVFLDLNLEGTDSIDCLRHLLTINNHSKIILVAPINRKPKIEQGFEQGAAAYLLKPFSRRKVQNAIDISNSGDPDRFF